MKYNSLLVLTLLSLNANAEGVGTRGTGIGKRGRDFNNVLNIADTIGGYDSSIRSGTKGVGTRGTNKGPLNNESIRHMRYDVTSDIKLSDIFYERSPHLEHVFSSFISSMQDSFSIKPERQNLLDNSFSNWAATHAGELVNLFESTQWVVEAEDDSLNTKIDYELKPEEKTIYVTSSAEKLNSRLEKGNISKALAEFFVYANAPFSASEIEFELFPIEKNYINLEQPRL